MKINYAMIGYRIRVSRNRIGISQQELAEKANISVTYLCSIENARKKPSLGSLMLLSEALDISLDQLITGAIEQEEAFDVADFFDKCSDKERRYFTELLQNSKHLLHKYLL